MKQITIGLILVLLLLGGCGGRDAAPQEVGADEVSADVPAADEPAVDEPAASETTAEASDTASQSSTGSGMGMGTGGGMMGGRMDPEMRARHQAPIPEEYAGLTSPIADDAESLARGDEVYSLFCVACHGESGMGDGPTAAALNPAPPSLAMTSRMMGDDYLFWRISEGGAFPPFNSAMPPWKASVNEEDRWHLINYMRTLGDDAQVGPGMSGGMEQAMRAEMLTAGEEQGIITADEATLFNRVHDQIDAQLAASGDRQFTGNMSEVQGLLLDELVEMGEVSAEDAASFNVIHDRLLEAGLMQ